MSVSTRKVEAKTEDVLTNIESMQRQFDALSKRVSRSQVNRERGGASRSKSATNLSII